MSTPFASTFFLERKSEVEDRGTAEGNDGSTPAAAVTAPEIQEAILCLAEPRLEHEVKSHQDDRLTPSFIEKEFNDLPRKIRSQLMKSDDVHASLVAYNNDRSKVGMKKLPVKAYLEFIVARRKLHKIKEVDDDGRELQYLALHDSIKEKKKNALIEKRYVKYMKNRLEQIDKKVHLTNRRQRENPYEDMTYLQLEKLAIARNKNKTKTNKTKNKKENKKFKNENKIKIEVENESLKIPGVGMVDVHKFFHNRYMKMLTGSSEIMIFGSFICYIWQMFKADGILDYTAATFQFCRATLPHMCSTMEGLEKFLEDSELRIDEDELIALKDELPPLENNIQVNNESWSENTESLRVFLSKAVNSTILTSAKNLLLAVASMKLFSKPLATKLYGAFGKPEPMSLIGAVDFCLVQLVSLLRVGERLIAGHSFSSILLEDDPLTACILEVNKLLFYKDKLYTSLKGKNTDRMNRNEYIMKAHDMLSVSELLIKEAHSHCPKKKELVPLRLKLLQALADIRNAMLSEHRITPLLVVITGPPGIGKSNFINYVPKLICKVLGIEYNPCHTFCKNAYTDFWDGYLNHIITVMSDVGNTNVNLASTKGDDGLSELTPLCDPAPYVLNMAFTEKGKVCFNSFAILIDSNNVPRDAPMFNYNVLVSNSSAYERRALIIEIGVLAKYKLPGFSILDPEKTLSAEDPNDLWSITCYRKIPKSSTETHVDILLDKGNMKAFTNFFLRYFAKHIRSQLMIRARRDNMKVDTYADDMKDLDLEDLQEEVRDIGLDDDIKEFVHNEAEYEFVEDEDYIPPQKPLHYRIISHVLDTYVTCKVMWFNFYHQSNFLNRGLHFASTYVDNRRMYYFYWSLYCLFGVYEGENVALSFIECLSILLSIILVYIWGLFFSFIPIFLVLFLLVTHTKLFADYARDRVRDVLRDRYEACQNRKDFMFDLKNNADFPIIGSNWWQRNYSRVAMLMLSIGVTYKIYNFITDWSANEVTNEAHTDFVTKSAIDEKINIFEEDAGCGKSYEKVPLKTMPNYYNIVHKVKAPCVHTGDLASLSNAMFTSIRRTEIHGKGVIKTFILGICKNIAIINTHALSGDDPKLLRVSNIGGDLETCTNFVQVLLNEVTRVDLDDDISLVMIPGLSFKDKLKHVGVDDYDLPAYNGMFRNSQQRMQLGSRNLDFSSGCTVSKTWSYRFPDHYFGACGLPIFISKESGCVIGGIHTGTGKKNEISYGSVLDRHKIEDGILKLGGKHIIPVNSEAEFTFVTKSYAPKATTRHEIMHAMKNFGQLEGPVLVNQKSRIVKTKFFDSIQSIFKEEMSFVSSKTFMPPVMGPITVDGEYINPMNNAVKAINKQKGYVDMKVVDEATGLLIDHIISELEKVGVTALKPLTMEVAINAIEQDVFLRRINVTTSAGFPYHGKKSDYLPKVSETVNLIREATPEIRKEIMDFVEAYSKGLENGVVFIASLKDEPREAHKVKQGNTRVFYVSPLAYLIISRMFLAPFFTLVTQFGEIFMSAVGINAHSDADKLARDLKAFSLSMMALDAVKFDLSLPFEISLGVSSVIYGVLARLGYNQIALMVVQGLLSDNLMPLVVMNQEISRIAGITVSGDYATAERNGLKLLLMYMVFWLSHPVLKQHDFFKSNKLNTFGDDFLNAILEALKQWANNVTFAAFCKEIYNMDMTPDNKETVMRPTVSLEECTFLKRNFVYREDIDKWVMPLDLNSVVRALQWTIPNNAPEIQMKSTLESELWELALHLNEEQHDRMRVRLEDVYAEEYLLGQREELPQYHTIMARIFPDLYPLSLLNKIYESPRAPIVAVVVSPILEELGKFYFGWMFAFILSLLEYVLIRIKVRRSPSSLLLRIAIHSLLFCIGRYNLLAAMLLHSLLNCMLHMRIFTGQPVSCLVRIQERAHTEIKLITFQNAITRITYLYSGALANHALAIMLFPYSISRYWLWLTCIGAPIWEELYKASYGPLTGVWFGIMEGIQYGIPYGFLNGCYHVMFHSLMEIVRTEYGNVVTILTHSLHNIWCMKDAYVKYTIDNVDYYVNVWKDAWNGSPP